MIYWVLFLAKYFMYYRSMDVHGLIGYIGGYIGLFVGYSVLQIPDTILILKGKCEKLYLKARNYNSYWKEEKSCDWSDAVQSTAEANNNIVYRIHCFNIICREWCWYKH